MASMTTASSGTSGTGVRDVVTPWLWMISAQAIGSGLGFAFWTLTARMVSPAVVATVAAGVAAQQLLGKLATLGIGTYLISELPLHTPLARRRLIRAGCAAVVLCGCLLAGAFLAVAGAYGANFERLREDPAAYALFVLGAGATGVGLVLDQAVLGLGRSRLQVTRNLTASALRFPILLVAALVSTVATGSLLLAWVAPLVVSLVAVARATRLLKGVGAAGPALDVRRHGGQSLRHYAIDVALSAGPLLVPVVAATVLRPTTYAEFSIAWLIATFVYVPPAMLADALFASSANQDRAGFLARAARTLPLALGVSLTLCLCCWAGGPLVLTLFGSQYAGGSPGILDLLVLGGLWMVFKDHYVAARRSERRLGVAARFAAATVVIEVVGAGAGGLLHGATGLCLGWLAAAPVELCLIWPQARELVVNACRPRHEERNP